MPLYLDTRSNAVLGVGECDRCHFKFPLLELMPDPNFPGLRVCKKDLDQFDPYRLPPPQADIFNLPFTRPDANIGLPEDTSDLVPPTPPVTIYVLSTEDDIPLSPAPDVELRV